MVKEKSKSTEKIKYQLLKANISCDVVIYIDSLKDLELVPAFKTVRKVCLRYLE